VACLSDLNVVLEGLRDDAMIIYEFEMEMVCYFIGYESGSMSCMVCCLYMILMLWEILDCWVEHV